jgi:hypothetical protein
MKIHKLNEQGVVLLTYEGLMLERSATSVCLQAFFGRPDYVAAYHTFRRGDRMVEWFYSDQWFNIFQMHDVDDDHLTGWYCNITRPARIEDEAVYAEDLALDLMVYPDGRTLLLDQDEFEALALDSAIRQAALVGLAQLQQWVAERHAMFAAIHP